MTPNRKVARLRPQRPTEHIKAYVRETGMIYPFDADPDRGAVKSASYEARAAGQFIYWDQQGKKVVQPIKKDGSFTLPPNSISFVQIESEFRLPLYIAVRFNLRITHVHRGLLLGTGPLVDPGFHGNLLVPLHNLTSEEYTIRGDEGLIWMEFTKTSHCATEAPVMDAPDEQLDAIEKRKNDQPPEYYFDRASKNRPIQSSIPLVVAGAEKLAKSASSAAKRAERTNRIFVGAGILAIAGTMVGLFSLVTATHNLIANVSSRATEAASDAKRTQDDVKALRTQIDAADIRRAADEVQRIRAQLDDARAQIETLKAEMRDLKDQGQRRP